MFNDDFIIGEFIEGNPASRPAGYTDEAIWRRIEQYVVWRWGPRDVEWTLRGEGFFVPPLKPVTINTVERFNLEGTWVAYNNRPTPFGVRLGSCAFYKITGTAGTSGNPPEDVLEAFTRMKDYLAAVQGVEHVGATSVAEALPGVSLTVHRPAQSMARALEYSGAADILKAYRHV